jgi:hypothetical protein
MLSDALEHETATSCVVPAVFDLGLLRPRLAGLGEHGDVTRPWRAFTGQSRCKVRLVIALLQEMCTCTLRDLWGGVRFFQPQSWRREIVYWGALYAVVALFTGLPPVS